MVVALVHTHLTHANETTYRGDTVLEGQRCLVTGGAGTIGSTIVDQLVGAGADEIIVLDNLVRGRRENLAQALT